MKLSPAAWESLCACCGRCCYEKYEYQGQFFYTTTPCEYLDLQNHLCRVYHQRQEKQPDCSCLTPELVRSGVLPADCPYVMRLKMDPGD